VLRAYGELMPHGRYPGALVFIEVPPAEVDVNVHPAKAEVRLADAKAAWDAIHTGLTRILARGDWMPRQGTAAVEPSRSLAMPESAQRVAEAITRYGNRNLPATWWMPPAHAAHGAALRDGPTPPELLPRPEHFKSLRYLGQLHRAYLVCEGPQGLVLVDQHAAHERMNYQRLRASAPGSTQPLLVPQIVALASAVAARVAEAKDLLASIGLETEPFGEGSIAIKTLPPPLARLTEQPLAALLADLSDELALHGRGESLERLRDALLARAACHGSIRAHDALTPQEAQALLDALDATDYGARCAHGRPVLASFDTREIERRFGRDYASHSHAAPEEAL